MGPNASFALFKNLAVRQSLNLSNFFEKKSPGQESNPGRRGEKRQLYPSAMPSPQVELTNFQAGTLAFMITPM